ncbi:hypothetical protein OZN62_12125 [Aurantiacibacter sp. MUD11]|uniref:hypothetical protein n=1 Tax=Aurantiacibacter sp. MUD11 TaxID=3003265 RepID=UPI0022AB0482|nr:hypothetical protein [Aurantiacibacter sp. MUD11]WAT17649.1 hypothetical protein OZN62_12125 [Aurantiacibacter sp. MUD11]
MSQGYQFYMEQAEKAATDAKDATLENVRDRHLRAEETWRGLAEQSRKVEEDRVKAKEERRLRIEAEMLEARLSEGNPDE